VTGEIAGQRGCAEGVGVIHATASSPQLGENHFTAFQTGTAKSREAFLALLRAGYGDYIANAAALAHMRGRSLSGPMIEILAAHPVRMFADAAAWRAHLAALSVD
jgi:hypothetical protein